MDRDSQSKATGWPGQQQLPEVGSGSGLAVGLGVGVGVEIGRGTSSARGADREIDFATTVIGARAFDSADSCVTTWIRLTACPGA